MRLINKNFSGSKICAAVITLCTCWIMLTASAAEDQSFAVFRNRLYKLKHISATDAGMFLVDLKIGNQIMVMSDNSMMISSDVPSDLTKASSILEVIDSPEPFVLRTLAQISDFQTIPSVEQIEEKIPYMAIGTFNNPPADDSRPKAIIDMHETNFVAIAGPDYIQNIKETIGILQYPNKPVPEKPSIEEELYAAKKELEELKNQMAQPSAPTIGYVSEDLLLDELSKDQQQMNTYESPETITPQPQLVFQSDSPSQEKVSVSQEVQIGKDDSSQTPPEELEQQQPEVTNINSPEMPDAEKELELTLTLPEKVEILSLLELVGKQLGLNYIYDPKEIKGEIMLKVHDGKIKVKDTYALLESVLKFRGLVMTRRGNLVTIVPGAKALEFDPVLRTGTEDIQLGDVVATTVFRLNNISTKSAQDLLTSMKLGTTFNAIPETGTLIVTGYAYRMERIEKILKLVDVPGKPLNIRMRQINYIVAEGLAPKIKTLAEKLGTVSISVSAPAPKTPATKTTRPSRTPRTPTKTTPSATKQQKGVYLEVDERTNRILMVGTEEELNIVDSLIDILDIEKQDFRSIREYEIQHVDPIVILETLNEIGIISTAPARSTRSSRSRPSAGSKTTAAAITATAGDQNPLTEEPQISILEATHSMLINATPEQHDAIAKIIAHVDRRLDRTSTPYVVYQLENQDPVELEEVLTKLIEKTKVEAIKSSDPKAQTKATSISQSEENIYIIADPATYSLIVYADKKNQQWISDIITELDQYRSQVLLDVTLVEIQKDDEFKFDLDIISRSGGFNQGGSMDSGAVNSSLSADQWGPTILEAGFNSAAELTSFTAFYADRHIQALLETVDKKGYGRILARPSILVKDNEEGKIGTTETIYVAEEKSNVVGGGSTNPAVTTTDISFKSYDSGIDLLITPHITSKDLLQLAIELKRKDFKDRTDNSVKIGDKTIPKPLDTVESNVLTVATIPDGATIILGGIEKISQNKGVSKVPFLGDIPLVGMLFRGVSDSDIQTRLYVFVKAHIIEPSDALTGYSDIERISQKKRRSYEEAEARFQGLQFIPGVDPDPMDPLRILEDDEPLN
jgi:general secretion pathway protein D